MFTELPTEEDPRLNGLDHVRAAAILLVLLYHYRLFAHPEWVDRIGNFGWSGVDLFFVLSGYLIGGQLLKQAARDGRIDLRDFYLKRSFRILPAYLFIVALYFMFPVLREWEAPAPLWKYLTFTQNIGLDLLTQRTFSHAWSLCIEEQFYLLCPLLILSFLRCRALKWAGWLLAFLFLFGIAVRDMSWDFIILPTIDTPHFGVTWYEWMYYPVWTRLDGLLAGVAVAGLILFRPAVAGRILGLGNWLFPISGLLIGAAFLLCDNAKTFVASVFGFPIVAVAYASVIFTALSPKSLLFTLSSRFSREIAVLSYSIYLSHKIVIHLVQMASLPCGLKADSNPTMGIALIAVFATAWIMHQLIEKPFLRWRDRVLAANR